MKIYGFIGPKGAGKDEAHKLLKGMGRTYGKVSFAGPLKQICSDVFGIPLETMNDPILKEKELAKPITLDSRALRKVKKELSLWVPEVGEDGRLLYSADAVSLTGVENRIMKTPRELLQVIGTDFIRNKVHTNWHLLAAFGDKAMAKLKEDKNYSVTDIRFPNELKFLQDKFGDSFKAFYIQRPEAEERLDKATHPSELMVKDLREMLPKGSVLKNEGSIEDFKKVLKQVKAPSAGKGKTAKTKESKFVFGAKN